MKRSRSLGICCRVLELPGQLIGELTLASGRPESSRCRISGVCGWLRWIPIGQPNSAVYSHKASSFKQGVFFSSFRSSSKIEVRLIHTLQPQEMHSAETISCNDGPVVRREGAGLH